MSHQILNLQKAELVMTDGDIESLVGGVFNAYFNIFRAICFDRKYVIIPIPPCSVPRMASHLEPRTWQPDIFPSESNHYSVFFFCRKKSSINENLTLKFRLSELEHPGTETQQTVPMSAWPEPHLSEAGISPADPLHTSVRTVETRVLLSYWMRQIPGPSCWIRCFYTVSCI